MLERGALYTVLLRVTDGRGQAAVAPEASLGLSFGSDNAAIERRVLRGAYAPRSTRRSIAALSEPKLSPKLASGATAA